MRSRGSSHSRPSRRPRDNSPLQYGDRIGPYLITGFAGRGGTSYVYRARRQDSFEPVAIKVLHPRFVDDARKRRKFFREARLLLRMEHPNIVGFREILDEQDHVAFVMDYIEGATLDTWLDRHEGGLDESTLIALFVDVLRGVAHTHERGIIHRDLKPSNILIEHSGGRLRARLIDFGVARQADRPLRRDELDKIEGTAAYISPEEIRDPETVCRSSDLYSLGVVMYEAACGRRPFEADDSSRLFAAHTSQTPPSPRACQSDLSSALASILLKALAKRPVSRFGSADEMIEALERAVRRRIGERTRGEFAVEEVVETQEWSRDDETPAREQPEWTSDEAERLPLLMWLEMALTVVLSTGHTGRDNDPHHLSRDHSPDLEVPQV